MLASEPWDAGQVALSDTRIVWMGVTGPNTYSGSYDTARLYWSPRALDPDNIVIQPGPVLPPDLSLASFGEVTSLSASRATSRAERDAPPTRGCE